MPRRTGLTGRAGSGSTGGRIGGAISSGGNGANRLGVDGGHGIRIVLASTTLMGWPLRVHWAGVPGSTSTVYQKVLAFVIRLGMLTLLPDARGFLTLGVHTRAASHPTGMGDHHHNTANGRPKWL